jgi:hypothetical protein
VSEPDVPALLPPICEDCGHRASLHHLDGCRALLLGRDAPARICGCRTTLREILARRYPPPPAELTEQRSATSFN